MQQGRTLRLVVGFLLPTIVGAVPMIFAIFQGASPGKGAFFLLLILACLVMAVPAAIYTSLMEYVINDKLIDNKLVVFSSSLIGGLIGAYPSMRGLINFEALIFLYLGSFVGLFAGFISGIVLRWLYNLENRYQVPYPPKDNSRTH